MSPRNGGNANENELIHESLQGSAFVFPEAKVETASESVDSLFEGDDA